MHHARSLLTSLAAAMLCALCLSACGPRIGKTPQDTSPPPKGYPGQEASKQQWRDFSKQRGAELGKMPTGGRSTAPTPGQPTGPPTGGGPPSKGG